MHHIRQEDLPFKGSSPVHEFKCIGDSPLVQLDVHLSPKFIQEDLSPS